MKTEFLAFLKTHYNKEVIWEEENSKILLPDLNVVFQLHFLDNQPQLMEKKEDDSFKVIHLWEDCWLWKREVIESRVKSLMGITQRIYGRKTKIVKLTKPEVLTFLDDNHLQVSLSGKYKYGLLYQDELVAAMCFSRGMKIEREGEDFHSFEMLRFCNKLGVTVTGGMSKLLNHFIREYQPDDIMSYADCDWSDGQAYYRLGFDYMGFIEPIYFWVDKENKQRIYSGKLPNYITDKIIQSEVDEDTFMRKEGYVKVCNSGSLKFLRKEKSC